MNTDQLIFIEACTKKGRADEHNAPGDGKNQYNILVSVFRKFDCEGRMHELLGLLNHGQPYVVLWAGAFCLRDYPDAASAALEKLAQGRGAVAFNAKVTLSEYRKGHMTFQF